LVRLSHGADFEKGAVVERAVGTMVRE